MLSTLYIINFLGMILLPIVAWIFFTRKFALSWKLVLAGGLTFIASQIPHIPLVFALNSFLARNTLLVQAVVLGLLAGVFEETARYFLFKYILKNSRTWKEGILVGLGHGGMEALIFGALAALGFFTMVTYRSIDLSTVPSIPADQLELAKQQVAAYWSSPPYMAIMGFVERIFAMCLHVGLSVMVLYALARQKPIWFWLALLWHALVDAVAVYMVAQSGIVQVEASVAILALMTIGIVFALRHGFHQTRPTYLKGEHLQRRIKSVNRDSFRLRVLRTNIRLKHGGYLFVKILTNFYLLIHDTIHTCVAYGTQSSSRSCS